VDVRRRGLLVGERIVRLGRSHYRGDARDEKAGGRGVVAERARAAGWVVAAGAVVRTQRDRLGQSVCAAVIQRRLVRRILRIGPGYERLAGINEAVPRRIHHGRHLRADQPGRTRHWNARVGQHLDVEMVGDEAQRAAGSGRMQAGVEIAVGVRQAGCQRDAADFAPGKVRYRRRAAAESAARYRTVPQCRIRGRRIGHGIGNHQRGSQRYTFRYGFLAEIGRRRACRVQRRYGNAESAARLDRTRSDVAERERRRRDDERTVARHVQPFLQSSGRTCVGGGDADLPHVGVLQVRRGDAGCVEIQRHVPARPVASSRSVVHRIQRRAADQYRARAGGGIRIRTFEIDGFCAGKGGDARRTHRLHGQCRCALGAVGRRADEETGVRRREGAVGDSPEIAGGGRARRRRAGRAKHGIPRCRHLDALGGRAVAAGNRKTRRARPVHGHPART